MTVSPVSASLNVSKGFLGTSIIPIDKPFMTAGNSDAVDIKLENPFVSRRHFQIKFESDVFYISDLGSTNGTYLNGIKLSSNEEHILRDGDKVGLGVDEVILVFSGPARTVRIDTPVIARAVPRAISAHLHPQACRYTFPGRPNRAQLTPRVERGGLSSSSPHRG